MKIICFGSFFRSHTAETQALPAATQVLESIDYLRHFWTLAGKKHIALSNEADFAFLIPCNQTLLNNNYFQSFISSLGIERKTED